MHETPHISPDHKAVTRETLAALPKVVLDHRVSPAAVSTQVEKLAAEQVRYVELLVDLAAGGQAALDSVLADLDIAGIDARVILTAAHGAEVAATVELVLGNYGEKVIGFNLAGIDDDHLAGDHGADLQRLRENFIPFSVELGEAAEVPAISDAVLQGAARLGNGLRIFEDFAVDVEGIHPQRMSAWVRDRHLLLTLAPTEIVDEGTTLADHPLPLLQDLGFRCAVHPGTGSMTDEWWALTETFDYGLDEFFELTTAAIDHSFAAQERRDTLLVREILPGYEDLVDPESQDGFSTDTAADAAAAESEDK